MRQGIPKSHSVPSPEALTAPGVPHQTARAALLPLGAEGDVERVGEVEARSSSARVPVPELEVPGGTGLDLTGRVGRIGQVQERCRRT